MTMTPEAPRISPTLEAFFESEMGRSLFRITGSDLEVKPFVIEQDEKAGYYSFEFDQLRGHCIAEVVLIPSGQVINSRFRNYSQEKKLVSVSIIFQDTRDNRKSMHVQHPSTITPYIPSTEFLLDGFFARYTFQKGTNINALGYDKGGKYQRIYFERQEDGILVSNTSLRDPNAQPIGVYQTETKRSSVRLIITEHSTKKRIILTVPRRINTNWWFQQMSVLDRSWLNLVHNFPLELEIISPSVK